LRVSTTRRVSVIAISKAVLTDASVTLGPRVPAHLVYNAIDVDTFSPPPSDAPREGLVRVGLVATYARWKGQDLFLRTAAKLVRDRPELPARFVIVGGPVYRTIGSQFTEAELRALAAELGLGGWVDFIPFQEKPADVFRTLDVVVHASTSPEPFGRTIVEAMACGRAVVASRAGGAAELFTEGQDALGFEPGNADEMACVIRRLIEEPDLRARLGAAARTTAEQRFDRRRMADQLLSVYRPVAGENR
jgi:glycosyltransferase involved in cell wall biosynthesis